MTGKGRAILVTGSCGLIGSEICRFFHDRGWAVHGIDNNQRLVFFGPQGDIAWNLDRMVDTLKHYQHHHIDIRDRQRMLEIVRGVRPQLIVHAAAQPSHDRAAEIPLDDFDTNAVGTINTLEAARQYCPEAPFVHMSTNKVYGDGVNRIALTETPTRWDYDDAVYCNGIPETFPIDHALHSVFGASKVAADIMVQEYGRYYGMPTCCLRGGCLTGPNHSGVELHGFLSYLVKCAVERTEYVIRGYKGKQVRDNIHSLDVAAFIFAFYQAPRVGEVYNIGGGKGNSCSIIEAMNMLVDLSGRQFLCRYATQNRAGDHICYYSDLSKIKSHYPGWEIGIPLSEIIQEMYLAWRRRRGRD